MTDTSRMPLSDARLFKILIVARAVRGELSLLGLTPEQLLALLSRHSILAGLAPDASRIEIGVVMAHSCFADFATRMKALLLSYANPDAWGEDVDCLAAIIANACLRPDHLWRDLGLQGREDVTEMLERFFPELAARNVDGLRWKKFLAQELALAAGEKPGPAPGCPGCDDYKICFPLAGFQPGVGIRQIV